MNEQELEEEIEKVKARKKPVENAGDWYDEQRRKADELRLKIELAKLRGEPIRKLEQDLESALYVGD